MPNKIVLVRHGQAENRSPHVPDSQRRLTAYGLETIERAYPKYFASIPEEGEDITVFSSTATRTMQTARVICKAMGVSENNIATLGSLTNQNAEEAIDDILSRDGVVVAVGHSPSIDEIASRLSGRMRVMLRGEALCLDSQGRYSGMPVLWDCTVR